MVNDPAELHAIAAAALDLIHDGNVVGLGTGHAATAFIHTLGKRGLRVRGIPTSQASADLARQLGIPLTTLEEAGAIDVAVDGADEVDPQLNLIKGYGGALVREKIVAAAARRFVVLVGPEKLVPVLGTRGRLPVTVPATPCRPGLRRRAAHARRPALRHRQRQRDPRLPHRTAPQSRRSRAANPRHPRCRRHRPVPRHGAHSADRSRKQC
jgi:ribose 5-phosphate isomerase A